MALVNALFAIGLLVWLEHYGKIVGRKLDKFNTEQRSKAAKREEESYGKEN